MSDRRFSVAHPVAVRLTRVAAVSTACALAFASVVEGGGHGRGGGEGSGTGLHHFGMLHSPLGGATLSPQPNGSLAIENIGSSGQDGVSIDLGRSPGASVSLQVASGGSVTCETVICKMGRVELALAGTGTGTTQEFGILMTDQGGGVAAIGPHLLNVSCPRVAVACRLNGALCDGSVIPAPLPPQFLTAALGATDAAGVVIESRAAIQNFSCEFVDGRYILRSGVPIHVSVAGGPLVLADEIEILYSIDRGNNENWDFTGASILASVASGTASMNQLEARLQALGILARSIGGAGITGLPTRGQDQDCDLRVSNIGSSGQDGVSIDISRLSALGVPSNIGINEPIPDVTLHFAQPMDVASQGTGLQMRVDGEMDNSTQPLEIGRLSLQPLGGAITVHGDLTVAGSATLDVTVLSEGQVMGVVTVPDASMIGMITPGALGPPQVSSCGVARLGNPLVNEVAIGLVASFDRVAEFRPPGELPLACDQLRIAPTTPTNSVIVCSTTHLLSAGGGGGGAGGSFDIDELRLGPVNGGVERFGVRAMPIGGGISGTTNGLVAAPAPGSIEPFGFAVPLGAAQGAMVSSVIPQSSLLPILNRTILKSFYQMGDVPTQGQFGNFIDSFISRHDDGTTTLEVSVFGFDPEEIRATARMAGQVVASETFGSSMPASIAMIDSPSGSSSVTQGCTLLDVNGNGRPDMLELVFSEPIAFSASLGSGGSPVLADEIIVTIAIQEVGPIQACAVACLADGVSSFEVTDIATMQFDLPHRAVGESSTDSMMCGETTHFLVDNIGSSGNDGVSIDLERLAGRPPNNEISGFTLDATRSLDDGEIQRFDWTTTGRVNGGPSITIGSASFDSVIVGGDRSITIDQPIWLSQTSVVTRAYLGEQLVDESTGTALGVVVWTVTPTHICGTYEFTIEATFEGAQAVSSNGVTHSFRWDSAVDLDVVGMGPVHADRLDVRAVARGAGGGGGGSVVLEEVTVTGTVATGKLEVGISGETPILHDHCPADINNDTNVNVTDLLAVIGGWGACTTCPATMCASDTNRDCSTNVTDLLTVIGGWGTCD